MQVYSVILMNLKMFIKSFFSKVARKVKGFFHFSQTSNKDEFKLSENLTSIPGIGSKNCINFYKAGYKTPQSIMKASDEDLLSIPGVGISFIRRLRRNT